MVTSTGMEGVLSVGVLSPASHQLRGAAEGGTGHDKGRYCLDPAVQSLGKAAVTLRFSVPTLLPIREALCSWPEPFSDGAQLAGVQAQQRGQESYQVSTLATGTPRHTVAL